MGIAFCVYKAGDLQDEQQLFFITRRKRETRSGLFFQATDCFAADFGGHLVSGAAECAD